MPRGGNPKAVLAVSKRDGHVVKRFPSMKAAAEWAGCDQHTVGQAATNGTMGPADYMWRREGAWEGRETFDAKAKNRPVVVMVGGHLLWFCGPRDAAAALGVAHQTMLNVLSKQAKPRGGWQAAYLTSTEDWPRLWERFGAKGEEI